MKENEEDTIAASLAAAASVGYRRSNVRRACDRRLIQLEDGNSTLEHCAQPWIQKLKHNSHLPTSLRNACLTRVWVDATAAIDC